MGFYRPRSQEEDLTGVPLLTNVPESAESAAGMGRDVYFLSDRPETEEHLRTATRPYKSVLRDVQERRRPTEEELTLGEAWKDFKTTTLVPKIGYDPDTINPQAEGEKAKQAFIEAQLGGRTKFELDAVDPKQINNIYKEADKVAKAEALKAQWNRRNGQEIYQKFTQDYTEMLKKKKAAEVKPDKSQLYPVMIDGKTVWKTREEAIGMQAAPRTPKAEPSEEDKLFKLRKEAMVKAQRDPDWPYAKGAEEQEAIISKYVNMMTKGELAPPPKEIKKPPKGIKLTWSNKEHKPFLDEMFGLAMSMTKDAEKNKKKVQENFKELLKREGYF